MLPHIFVGCFLQALCVMSASISSHNFLAMAARAGERRQSSLKSDSVSVALDQSELAALARMKYWAEGGNPVPTTEQYVLFSNDDGGPNNMRIAWELAGVIAQHTNRTLVLPPASPMYLLDFGPMSEKYHPKGLTGTKTLIEDLVNEKQLKDNLATVSAAEFSQLAGVDWQAAVDSAKKAPKGECALASYGQMSDRFVFLNGKDRMPFSCGEWWLFGGPRDDMKKEMTEDNWRLLRQGFVWHDDVFNVAAKVVNYLGLFEYMAIHGRYNDFQFHEFQQPADAIFGKWKPWLKEGTTLYVATDDPSKFRGVNLPGVRLVMWDDLFDDTTGNLLTETKAQFTPERWFKLFGPIEELICTYSKLFVGTDRSSFSGHIERMRIHADAPVTTKLTHTDSVPQADIDKQIQLWNEQHRVSRKVEATAFDRFL